MIIIIFGPPGSGKGTQAKKIAAHFDIIHLSTGNVFRNAIREETELGVKIKNIMDAGQLVPDQTVVDLVEQTISGKDFDKGYILDGFPRTVEQAVAYDKLLARRNESLDSFLSLHVPSEELIKRMLARGEGRSDDTVEKIKVRLDVYEKETCPVINHYKKAGIFQSIDGTGSIDKIFNRILSALPGR